MSEKYQLPSESDEDDEDYLPEGQSSSSAEESDVERIIDEDCLENSNTTVLKRRTKLKNKVSKRVKNHETTLSEEKLLIETDENSSKLNNDEEQKKRADSLWADFLKDSTVLPKSKNTTDNKIIGKSETCSIKSKVDDKIKINTTVKFAGEKVEVEKEVFANSGETIHSTLKSENTRNVNVSSAAEKKQSKEERTGRVGVGGISAVLGRLGKKTKINTLEKSKLDWDNFKKQEKIEEEISSHNKGKDGYLEKQDFLQRADFRQFEIEKQLRNASRRNNR